MDITPLETMNIMSDTVRYPGKKKHDSFGRFIAFCSVNFHTFLRRADLFVKGLFIGKPSLLAAF